MMRDTSLDADLATLGTLKATSYLEDNFSTLSGRFHRPSWAGRDGPAFGSRCAC